MDIISKLLPAQIQKLLQDKDVVRDMGVLLQEMEKAVDAARKDSNTVKSLKDAFNGAATALSAARTYLDKGKMPVLLAAKLMTQKGELKEAFQTLRTRMEAKDPILLACAQSLRENETFNAALKRVMLKTHGSIFRLETDGQGQHYAVEMLTGKEIKFVLEQRDFDEIQKALSGKNTPPPNAGPGM